jgi:hypothetical protein
VGALTTNRETATVAETTVRAQVSETLDVHADLLPQLTLDRIAGLDNFADTSDFVVGELEDPSHRVEARLRHDLLGGGLSDPVDVGERNPDRLLPREVNAFDSSHGGCPSSLQTAFKCGLMDTTAAISSLGFYEPG